VLNRIEDSMTPGDEEKRAGTPIVFEWVPLKKTYVITPFWDESYTI